MNSERKLVTKKDLIIILILLAAAVCALAVAKLRPSQGKTAVISVGSKEYMRIELDSGDREIVLENGVKILLRDGKIGFAESNCHDKICVKTGMLSQAGDVAACVPNRTVITVVGEAAAVDTLTY